jgi:hypothetical protein
MRLAQTTRIRGEGGLALLIIVALLVCGIIWWLYSARQDAEKNARVFATEVATKVVKNYDEKYLHVHLSPDAQKTYLRSSRDRLLDRIKDFGVLTQPIDIQGNVEFTSYFFDPHGTFHAQLKYPTGAAQLDMDISRGMTVWQVDSISLSGNAPPPPTPAATPVVTASPTPAPEPEQKPRRKRR